MNTAEHQTTAFRRPTVADKREARRLYIQGHGSARVIAQRCGLSFATVRDWVFEDDWQGLREEYEARQRASELGPEPPQPKADQQPDANPQIERIKGQLEKLERLMDDTQSADELSKLAGAHSKLFDTYCTLTGIQRPGVRKSKRPSGSGLLAATPEPQPL